jgi:hypothetical protein
MQIVVDFGLGCKQYVKFVRERGIAVLPIPDWALECPFGHGKHRLRRHGSYRRWATSKDSSDLTEAVRLLCVLKGWTVSLLPLCLAPKKQHDWIVIGQYLQGRLIENLSRIEAMQRATTVNPSRQTGEYWERCLIRGRPKAETYLGSGRRESFRGNTVASYIRHLKEGFKSLGDALAFHNRRIRERLGVWLL